MSDKPRAGGQNPDLGVPFMKMHGLGNDFVVLDARARPIPLTAERIRRISERRTGVGCDQLIRLEASDHADLFMRIYNADGLEVEACGNATRCIGALLFQERDVKAANVDTVVGLLKVSATGAAGDVAVDMGIPKFDWQDIPLASPPGSDGLFQPDTSDPRIQALGPALAVNVGNPHAVFRCGDAEAVDLADIGPVLEHHTMFPQRINVEAVSHTGRNADGHEQFRMRVWERGVGITRACGTGAAAAAVAMNRLGLSGRHTEIILDGGPLRFHWREADDHIVMTGPASLSYCGTLPAHWFPDRSDR